MLTQSPGNRLSHLAKRRAVFSSANLATNSQKLNSSIGPQILLDKKWVFQNIFRIICTIKNVFLKKCVSTEKHVTNERLPQNGRLRVAKKKVI